VHDSQIDLSKPGEVVTGTEDISGRRARVITPLWIETSVDIKITIHEKCITKE